ncbi:MAG TPA: nucleotide exchange factor GrpE [Candidatus Aphodousia faecipullorum]|nr:nucleotide exchange factor GrpE [Candidatus Aphodousia faecipullorum]
MKQNASDDQVQEQAQSNCENQEAAQSEASSEQATAAAEPQTTQEAAVEPSVEELLEAAKAENAKLQDLYMRALAEMENSRRRAEEAVEKAHKFGVEKFAKNMLPVLDSLEKALELAGEERNPMIEGIEATYRQMVQAMQQSGMTEINPVGEKFDPAVHQAIAMVPAQADQVSGQVAQVFQRGWLINGRVLRAAMVSVIQ